MKRTDIELVDLVTDLVTEHGIDKLLDAVSVVMNTAPAADVEGSAWAILANAVEQLPRLEK